jgi:hypothetical protein
MLVMLVMLPTLASADPCVDGVRDGVALRRAGRDAEALTLFRAVAERCPQPRVRVQLAWAEQAVGRWVDAERDLRAALATRDDAWVEQRRARLEQDLVRIREHLGEFQVTGGVAGAEVLLDGAVVATLPMTAPVTAVVGAARVELRREGYYPVRRDVTITAGVVAREEVQMRPEPAAPPVVATVAPPVLPPIVLAPPPTEPPPPSHVAPRRGQPDPAWRTVAWASTVTAAALAASTVGALVFRQVRYDDFQRDPGCFVDRGTGAPAGGGGCTGAHDDVQTASTAAIVTGVAAGAFAAGAVVAWVRARRASSTESVAWSCLPSPTGGACALSF